ncbi:MAG: ABC transporter ATP-binding protein [Planctomycetota bacterium]|jgi:putative ABC transport system ATP-binding protein
MSDALVRFEQVTRTFDQGRVVALGGVDLEIGRGEFVAVMGPSGSGKTTMLNLMGAMDLPTSGRVTIAGRAVDSRAAMEEVRAHEIGFVFQMHNLIPVLRAAENVEVPLVPRGMQRRERRRRSRELLEAVGLGDRADADVRVLSGGERQRIAVARALAHEPPLVLADEPTGNLDSKTGHEVMELLHKLRAETGAGLVLVTHNEEMTDGCDRLLRVHDGRLA